MALLRGWWEKKGGMNSLNSLGFKGEQASFATRLGMRITKCAGSDFALEGVFSFSSVSNRRMYFSKNFHILNFLLRDFQPFLSSFLPSLYLSSFLYVPQQIYNCSTSLPKKQTKNITPWFFLIPKCRLLSTFFFYQCISQWNVTHIYFTLKYLSMGFWRLLLSRFLEIAASEVS